MVLLIESSFITKAAMSRAENLTHEYEDNVTNWHNKNRKRAFDRFHTSLVQYVLIRFGGKDFAKKLTLQV